MCHLFTFYLWSASLILCVLMVQREEKFRSVLHADILVLLVLEFVSGKIFWTICSSFAFYLWSASLVLCAWRRLRENCAPGYQWRHVSLLFVCDIVTTVPFFYPLFVECEALDRVCMVQSENRKGVFSVWYSQKLPPLTPTVSKGQSGGQSGSNECFLRFPVKRKGLNHQGHRTTLGRARNSYKRLVRYVFLVCEMSYNTALKLFGLSPLHINPGTWERGPGNQRPPVALK